MTKKNKAKTQHTMCWTPLYANTYTKKKLSLLQTTGGKVKKKRIEYGFVTKAIEHVHDTDILYLSDVKMATATVKLSKW